MNRTWWRSPAVLGAAALLVLAFAGVEGYETWLDRNDPLYGEPIIAATPPRKMEPGGPDDLAEGKPRPSNKAEQALDYLQGLLNGYALRHRCFPRDIGARGELLDDSDITRYHMEALEGAQIESYVVTHTGTSEGYVLQAADAETGVLLTRRGRNPIPSPGSS